MKIQTNKGPIELSQELFWDVDIKRVPFIVEGNPYWVVPRIFEYGTLIEIDDIIKFYGQEQSKAVLIVQKNELKPMTKAMAHVFFRY